MSQTNFFKGLKNSMWLQAILAGLCLGVGFVVPEWWWFSLIGVIITIFEIKRSRSYKRVAMFVGVSWLIKYLGSLVWFFSVYPFAWMGIDSEAMQILLVSFYWFTSALWLAFGGVGFGLVARALYRQKQLPPLIWYSLVPFLWVSFELVGAYWFSIFTAGPGSFLQSYFSFGMIGYLLATTPFGLWVVMWVGVYGLGVLLVSLALGGYGLLVFKKYRGFLGAGCMIIIGLSIWPVGPAVPPVGVTVLAIDTQFTPELLSVPAGEMEKAASVSAAVKLALKQAPNAVILPEDSRYLESQFKSTELRQSMAYFALVHKNSQTLLIDSERFITASGTTVLRASVFDGAGSTIWQFDKQYLVPQGEFVPYVYQTVLRLLGFKTAIDAVAVETSYRPGPLLQNKNTPTYLPAVLFCFESVRPDAVSALKKLTAMPYVVHPISHSWFHQSAILSQQLDVMLQIQARVSGVSIVSAGNMTTGKRYAPNGQIVPGVRVGEGPRFSLQEYKF